MRSGWRDEQVSTGLVGSPHWLCTSSLGDPARCDSATEPMLFQQAEDIGQPRALLKSYGATPLPPP